MFDAGSPSEARAEAPQRAVGAVTVVAEWSAGANRLARFRNEGSAKALFPAARRRAAEGAPLEAVLLNTAGGLAGGDRFAMRCEAREGAALTVTTQAAERVYRSLGPDARVSASLTLGAGARLAWLPQETILFDGGRLRRRLEVDMAADARLVVAEAVTLGRGAMGETARAGFFSDFWRVRRAGVLVFADAARLVEPIDELAAGRATLAGGTAFASLVVVGPRPEAAGLERLRDRARAVLEGFEAVAGGASISGDALVCRLVAPQPAPLRRAMAALIETVEGAPPPGVWRI